MPEESGAAIERLHKKARALTSEPGVYLMHNRAGEIIYVGKAKKLKNRVSSYFRSLERHTPKVLAMVMQVEDFETIVTSSEFEALVLECSLIKLHNPKYNILLKDDKGYSYLRISRSDPYPRITEVKQKADDGAEYIGPYMSAWVVKNTIDEANKAFLLPTCTRQFPRDLGKGRPCLNFHMKQCMGVCRGKISSAEYCETVRQAVDYIKGGSADAVKVLTRQMESAAEALEFERAARCRDRLRAIERFAERQRVVYAGAVDQDVLAFVQSGADLSLSVLKFREQKLVDKLDFLFPEADPIEEVLLRSAARAAPPDSARRRAARPGADRAAAFRAGGPQGAGFDPEAGRFPQAGGNGEAQCRRAAFSAEPAPHRAGAGRSRRAGQAAGS